jgi:N-acyl-D-aspartate/D-glutamate deacylase
MYDLVIRAGTVADGTGAPTRTADVAIDNGIVVAVGEVDAPGVREIDADGALVTPGWVDIHTHYDGQVTWDPQVSPSGWHGVTTVVTGNCGVGFAPVRPGQRDFLIGLMEGVEDIPGAALDEGMTWNWESFGEYLDEVERYDRVLDVAALMPHGALRAYVLGSGRANDIATDAEIAEMAELVRDGIAAGAIGVSTTRTLLHRDRDGELAAGTTAAARELVGLAAGMAGAGHRVFSLASDMADLDGEFAWMAELSRTHGVPVTFQVLDADFAPDQWRQWIERAMIANRQGAWLVPQVPGKPTSLLVGWDSNFHPFHRYDTWQAIVHLPRAERLARLRDPATRAAMLAEPAPATGIEALLVGDLHKLYPLGDPPQYEPPADASIGAMADRAGVDGRGIAYDLMCERDGTALLYLPVLGYAGGSLANIAEMLDHPGTVLGLGDGGAHCGLLCDASLPTFMLTHWARDRSRGDTIPVEQVVAHQTSRTAALYGFGDRGVLAPGFIADVNIIDFDNLTLASPEMAWDLPAGGKRLIQRASGYTATVKSGVVVREHDQATGELPGRLLRGPQHAPVVHA